MCKKMKETINVPSSQVLVYAESQAARMVPTIRPLRCAHYDLCVLSFVDIEAKEHNDHVGSSEDNWSMDAGT